MTNSRKYVRVEEFGLAEHHLFEFTAYGKDIKYSYGIYMTKKDLEKVRRKFMSGLKEDCLIPLSEMTLDRI